MKLVLQIALGVFLGTLASQLTVDIWKTHREEAASAALRKQRAANEERVRALFMQNKQGLTPKPITIPPGFVPEDVQEEMSRKQ